LSDLSTIDIGDLLSNKLYGQNNEARLPLIANSALEEMLNANISDNPTYGRCLSIKNIGILLEPDLKMNLIKIFEKYSNNNSLFVQWDGDIDEQNLYFLTKEKGIKININELSHIAI
jgi:hypothetical protein